MDDEYAHIIVFGFNRPEHLRRCLESLKNCLDFDLYQGTIFIDGPRNPSEAETVELCRQIALNFSGGKFSVIAREFNMGLANSVRNGIDYIFGKYNSIIVIEDDLILGQDFLRFINSALNHYEDNSDVASISGFQYPLDVDLNKNVFLEGADCWGWGTWKNRWQLVNFNGNDLIKSLKHSGLTKDLDLENSIGYSKMLEMANRNEIDSWAIYWHVSMFLERKFTLYPAKSLVSNDGGDGTGTHFGINNLYTQELNSKAKYNFSDAVERSEFFRKSLVNFYKKTNPKISFFNRIRRKINRLLLG